MWDIRLRWASVSRGWASTLWKNGVRGRGLHKPSPQVGSGLQTAFCPDLLQWLLVFRVNCKKAPGGFLSLGEATWGLSNAQNSFVAPGGPQNYGLHYSCFSISLECPGTSLRKIGRYHLHFHWKIQMHLVNKLYLLAHCLWSFKSETTVMGSL